ncbi:glycosyltransferase family 4 protein [uncultured Thiohalocapsa sp.]|uniref:glycosyltransferase family 4 protein n=1 Tax=uncultured Thiohalocapsa sp. TaxID=768990 RepID=UPI0025FF947B|nr:glycosyltransferase family 4 protein [uncultured Thiohalocapsa sp.]
MQPHNGRPTALGRKVVFLVAVDWYFCLHWLPLALAVQRAGYEIVVMTEVTDTAQAKCIRAAGLRLVPTALARSRLNPVAELATLRRLVRLLRAEQPDLLHAIAQKPVIYGALAARLTGIRGTVATLAGLGYLFTSNGLKARLLRPLVLLAYRILLTRGRVGVIVQNPDDGRQLKQLSGMQPVLIKGAGVDPQRFAPVSPPPGAVTVVLASRMLWDKGVQEFVDAAGLLRERGEAPRMVLVGKPDQSNPAAVPQAQLQRWHDIGAVEWWGHRTDMPAVLAQAHIVCLPSYREGLPTILIEAAAAGLPLVATDVPGCREVVREGENGLLVPPRNAEALAEALARLAADAALRAAYGRASRRLAEAEFGIGRVAEETLAVYDKLFAEISAGQVTPPDARR